MRLSDHKNTATIDNHSGPSENKHKEISKLLSDTSPIASAAGKNNIPNLMSLTSVISSISLSQLPPSTTTILQTSFTQIQSNQSQALMFDGLIYMLAHLM